MTPSAPYSAFRLEELSAKIWRLTFDLPGEKVNKLSQAVLGDFEKLLPDLENLAQQGKIDALILASGKPGNFIAGADIEMIQSAKSVEEATQMSKTGQAYLNRWEDLPFPTVAAIQGAALGGGCEWSLACRAIVMSSDSTAKIGLPEVMLGFIPGMGGCVRLPRKVGLATALDLILTGRQLNGERAYKAGLADAFLQKENFADAVVAWTKSNLKILQSDQRIAREPKLGGMGGAVGTLLEKTPPGRMVMLSKAKSGVMDKSKGHYPAPLEALAVFRHNSAAYGPKLSGRTRDAALEREAEGFGRCSQTSVSKSLVRLFFLTESVKKSNGLPAGSTAVKTKPVTAAGVLGAGVMGGGIAQLLADKDISARMKDLNSAALSLGITSAAKVFQGQLKRKRLNRRTYMQKLSLISPVLDYEGFAGVDFVIEAVIEKMDIKKKVLRELEDHVRPDCVIASNTSSLSISEMQTAMKHPERLAGMHFFNPVHKMPLIEVIRGAKSSDEAVAAVFQFSKRLGKTPIVVKDAPGFLVNRLLAPYLNEAVWLMGEGASIPEIDAAMLEFGMPMGPAELIDEVGVDVGEKVAHILFDAFGARMQAAPYNAKVVAAGRLGKKSGKGLYTYENPKKGVLNPEIYSILGVTPKPGTFSAAQIVDRCVLPMINEAARCLKEGVVASPAEVDLGMIMGTGFPPFRGGLLRYADARGLKDIIATLEALAQGSGGEQYRPSEALLETERTQGRFYRDI